MNKPIIIGITGTLGAGKGTIVDYLVSTKDFADYSVRTFITEEIIKRGLPINRDTMRTTGNDLRKMYGGAWIVEQLLTQAVTSGKNAIIESVRTEDEVTTLQKNNIPLFSVDADIHIRFARIEERKSVTDSISFETFSEQEKLESESTNPAEQNLIRCCDLTDPRFRFTNNGSFEELHTQIDKALGLI
jgi:dephospho-CoA kinase